MRDGQAGPGHPPWRGGGWVGGELRGFFEMDLNGEFSEPKPNLSVYAVYTCMK